MEIMTKISRISRDMHGSPIPVIAFLGDSVTQGCFEVYLKDDKGCETVFEQQYACSSYVSALLKKLFPRANVCIVNAGISGDNATNGLKRLEQHVLSFHPDLVVVGYGLNDCNGDIAQFGQSLRGIFARLKAEGCEVIYLTPNMMNTYVDSRIPEPEIRAIAENTKCQQLEGKLDAIVEEARLAAQEYGVRICDIYQNWKLMSENGVDTTALLANRINHPDREMNWMTAYEVVKAMMQ